MGAGADLDGTSSLYVSIVIVAFVLFSKLIEGFFHRLKHYLHHRHEYSLIKVMEQVKDELMLVGTLSMFLIFVENQLATWCVPNNDIFVPKKQHAVCREHYASSTANATRRLPGDHGSNMSLLASGAAPTCDSGQVFFIETKALHQADFLIFYVAITHIVYTCIAIFTSRYWAKGYETWEAEVLQGGGKLVQDYEFKIPDYPKTFMHEYAAAFKKQFTFRIDDLTAHVLREFFLKSQNKPKDFRFFKMVKKELEGDFVELCGLDTILWIYTAGVLFSEGMENDDKGGSAPVGTIFGCLVSFCLGTKMLVIIRNLTKEALRRIKKNGAEGAGECVYKGLEIKFDCPWKFKGHGPTLLRWAIKLVMFQFSQKICFTIFYFQQFKGKGCYILSRGPASLIITSLIHGVMCFYIGLVLIPLYSLTKHLHIRTHEMGKHKSNDSPVTVHKELQHHPNASHGRPNSSNAPMRGCAYHVPPPSNESYGGSDDLDIYS